LSFDVRAGPIISLASIYDAEKQKFRQVMYRGFISELFVPYMDLTEEWYYRTFFDAGEYGFGLCAVQLEPLRDCPENAVFMDAYIAGPDGKPIKMSNVFCVFERYAGDIMWRHTELGIPGKVVSHFFLFPSSSFVFLSREFEVKLYLKQATQGVMFSLILIFFFFFGLRLKIVGFGIYRI